MSDATPTVAINESKPAAIVPFEPRPTPQQNAPAVPPDYTGAGEDAFTAEEMDALMAPFEDGEHDIKPTSFGEVFVPQVHVRKRLNRVLRGAWALVTIPTPNGAMYFQDDKVVCLRARLIVRGKFKAEAVGEQMLASGRMTIPSAVEAAKSDALSRCCKDLSIAAECWDKQWTNDWKQRFAVRVQVKRGKDAEWVWRRKDSAPLSGEIPSGRAAPTPTEPQEAQAETITAQQQGDLWAFATERLGRKKAQPFVKEWLASGGYAVDTAKLTPEAFKLLLADITKATEV